MRYHLMKRALVGVDYVLMQPRHSYLGLLRPTSANLGPIHGASAMIEFLLETAGVILFAIVAGWLGVEYETVDIVAAIFFGAAVLGLAVRSAYRDACRRQRWPGKNREKEKAGIDDHDSASSSPSATNR